jgi:hypothetical protein
MLKIDIFSLPKLSVFALFQSTEDIQRFVIGVRELLHQKLFGDGMPVLKSGTDTIKVDGITGVHPKQDLLLEDGLGIMDTGIIMVMYSNGNIKGGTDSKVKNGSSITTVFQQNQVFQEVQESAGLS